MDLPKRSVPGFWALPVSTRPVSTRPVSTRGGALIVEAVIALVLLATATVALTKLAKASAALGQQSDQRLTATLAAENTIQRLQGITAEQLADHADQVADLVGQDCGCEIGISTKEFTTANRRGIHVRVDARVAPAIRVSLHDWRFVSEPSDESDDSSDNTPTGGGDDA